MKKLHAGVCACLHICIFMNIYSIEGFMKDVVLLRAQLSNCQLFARITVRIYVFAGEPVLLSLCSVTPELPRTTLILQWVLEVRTHETVESKRIKEAELRSILTYNEVSWKFISPLTTANEPLLKYFK